MSEDDDLIDDMIARESIKTGDQIWSAIRDNVTLLAASAILLDMLLECSREIAMASEGEWPAAFAKACVDAVATGRAQGIKKTVQ